jgi:hypothetical protein
MVRLVRATLLAICFLALSSLLSPTPAHAEAAFAVGQTSYGEWTWGAAHNQSTRAEAEAHALAVCGRHSNNCYIHHQWKNGCFTVTRNPNWSWTVSYPPTVETALNTTCPGCKLEAYGCDNIEFQNAINRCLHSPSLPLEQRLEACRSAANFEPNTVIQDTIQSLTQQIAAREPFAHLQKIEEHCNKICPSNVICFGVCRYTHIYQRLDYCISKCKTHPNPSQCQGTCLPPSVYVPHCSLLTDKAACSSIAACAWYDARSTSGACTARDTHHCRSQCRGSLCDQYCKAADDTPVAPTEPKLVREGERPSPQAAPQDCASINDTSRCANAPHCELGLDYQRTEKPLFCRAKGASTAPPQPAVAPQPLPQRTQPDSWQDFLTAALALVRSHVIKAVTLHAVIGAALLLALALLFRFLRAGTADGDIDRPWQAFAREYLGYLNVLTWPYRGYKWLKYLRGQAQTKHRVEPTWDGSNWVTPGTAAASPTGLPQPLYITPTPPQREGLSGEATFLILFILAAVGFYYAAQNVDPRPYGHRGAYTDDYLYLLMGACIVGALLCLFLGGLGDLFRHFSRKPKGRPTLKKRDQPPTPEETKAAHNQFRVAYSLFDDSGNITDADKQAATLARASEHLLRARSLDPAVTLTTTEKNGDHQWTQDQFAAILLHMESFTYYKRALFMEDEYAKFIRDWKPGQGPSIADEAKAFQSHKLKFAQQAVRPAEQSVNYQPYSLQYLLHLVRVYRMVDRQREATKVLDYAHKLAPDDIEVLKMLP